MKKNNQLQLISKIENLIDLNYNSISISICKSLLAFSTLINLLFNSTETLNITLKKNLSINDVEYYSIFQFFNNLLFSKVLSIIILIVVIVGYFPKIMCLFHWWVSISIMLSSTMVEGGEQINSIITLFLIPISLFDNRKNHWINELRVNNFYKNCVSFTFIVIIKLQIFTIYFFASVGKFKSTEWVNGTALYYWVNDNVFGINSSILESISFVLKNPYMITLMTWGVLLLELIISISIFFSFLKLKKVIYYTAIFFHLLIALFLGLWSFFFVMFGILTLYYSNLNKKSNEI